METNGARVAALGLTGRAIRSGKEVDVLGDSWGVDGDTLISHQHPRIVPPIPALITDKPVIDY